MISYDYGMGCLQIEGLYSEDMGVMRKLINGLEKRGYGFLDLEDVSTDDEYFLFVSEDFDYRYWDDLNSYLKRALSHIKG